MVIVANICIRFDIVVGIGVGTFLLTFNTTQNSFQLHRTGHPFVSLTCRDYVEV
jgi:hypothetical protein